MLLLLPPVLAASNCPLQTMDGPQLQRRPTSGSNLNIAPPPHIPAVSAGIILLGSVHEAGQGDSKYITHDWTQSSSVELNRFAYDDIRDLSIFLPSPLTRCPVRIGPDAGKPL